MNTRLFLFLYNFVPFPLIKGAKFSSFYKSIMDSQYYNFDELKELVNKLLLEILLYASNNVPYYKEYTNGKFDLQDIKSLDELNLLPILRKEDVRKNYQKLTSREIEKKKYTVDFTSGSTGTSINIVKFKDSIDKALAFYWRYNNWAGIRFSDRVVIITGSTFSNNKFYRYSFNKLFLSAFHISKETLAKYAELICDFTPKALKGYPSAITIITRFMKKNNIKPPNLKSITLTAECLTDEIRKEIFEYWGCRIQNVYGQAENVVSIGECEEGNLHLSAEFGWMELVDENGKPVEVGKPGRIIGTGFTNYAMPLIRYDTRDVAVLSNEKCSCGRSLPVVKSIEGRSEDIIITPDGRMVGRLDAAFKYSTGIELSQIIQEDVDSINVKIVRGENYSPRDIDRLEVELRKRLGNEIKINYIFVDNIERTSLGKLRFVVSKVLPKI